MEINAPTWTQTKNARYNEKLWASAQKLEAVFISEMLKHSGYGKPIEGFGGGIGEDQFASLITTYQAQAIVESKSMGLAEKIFEAMKEKNVAE